MILIGYNFIDYTIPDHMDWVKFRAQVARAMRYVEKASKGNVKFLHRGLEMVKGDVVSVQTTAFVNIGFEDLPDARAVGEYSRTVTDRQTVVRSIAFDTKTQWCRGWWDRLFSFRPDFYAVAVHELGHLLGLDHNHYLDSESVMSEGARFSEFDEREIEHLRTMKP